MASSEELLNLALSRNNQLWGLTQPLREQGANTLKSVLLGAPASSLPAYAPNRAAIEGQYATTDNLLLNAMGRGGQLNAERADLLGKRAEAVSKLEADTRNDALNKALQLGFGQSGVGTTANLSAANTLMGQENKDAQLLAQSVSGGMTGLGLLLGMLGGWGK